MGPQVCEAPEFPVGYTQGTLAIRGCCTYSSEGLLLEALWPFTASQDESGSPWVKRWASVSIQQEPPGVPCRQTPRSLRELAGTRPRRGFHSGLVPVL